MPELIEVEIYRTQAEAVVGRTITGAPVVDDLGRARDVPQPEFDAAVRGARVAAARRHGKLLLLDTQFDGAPGPVIGLRFGMTGRLVIDGDASIDELVYGSSRDDAAFDRTIITFDVGELRLRDPRRLGGVELEPDTSALGPDAATLTAAQLRTALAGSTAAVKARLLDQSRVAGLGNLLVDESLWRAGVDPTTPAGEIADVAALARTIRTTVRTLSRRGGSHTGDLQPARERGATCPRDGAALRRDTVGGRTTFWCPVHQVRG